MAGPRLSNVLRPTRPKADSPRRGGVAVMVLGDPRTPPDWVGPTTTERDKTRAGGQHARATAPADPGEREQRPARWSRLRPVDVTGTCTADGLVGRRCGASRFDWG
ncbi:hypothetical protein Air01nite_74030 [Asanoa iriomotensis]|uniref:Uncharacterized protein n=1 Tax=Asanoa iriomotensis TaxID=234613 RepID=A0ABQ4CEW5_9ACTN|nr:hypothetical protein Air01nite_74030 [Asanoa iriomotensis]